MNGRRTDRRASMGRKYDFYRSLGYSAHASEVLSTFSYGDRELSLFVKGLPREEAVERIYSAFFTQDALSPGEALDAYHRQRIYSEERPSGRMKFKGRSAPASAAMGGGSSKMKVQNYIGSFERNMAPVAEKAPPPPSSNSVTEHYADVVSEEDDGIVIEEYSCVGPAPSVSGEEHFMSLAPAFLEATATDSNERIEEKQAHSVLTSPSSTFRMTTGTASMGMIMNQIRSGRAVKMDQVRIEEILNYFDYSSAYPTEEKFAVCTELLPKKNGKKLLYINAQAKAEVKAQQNIVLLLDVSGSMHGNRETTQEAIAAIFSELRPGDRISLVTYSTKDHTVLDGYLVRNEHDKETLMGVVLGLEIGGCTYGSAGINAAYALGAKYYHPEWSNQVILITDGDLNFGITDKGGLTELIEEKKKDRLFLSVIGTGLFNYKDDKLEVLSKHGNGTYCVVNELEDVEESVVRRYISLTNIIAKDVKAQVEFNPRFVKTYRLLGYENRELSHEDFKNDAVISEPYGSGGYGVALYELELSDGEAPESDLKYQRPVLTDYDELATVKIRYKEPLSDRSEEIETVVTGKETATGNAQLAYLLYCISETLRGSDKLDAYDREYLDVMITSGLYKNVCGANAAKLELLIGALDGRG